MEYQQILSLIAQKDKKGLEALYTTYGEKFYSHAVKRWLLSEDEAWDVVYQTLDTLILKLPDYIFESKAHFDNFIFKVFTNFLRQHFRSHRKNQFEKIDIDMDAGVIGTGDGTTDDLESQSFEIEKHSFTDYYKNEIIDNPKLLALQAALKELDEKERDLLLLRAQNYSYDEIAAMLGIENRQLKVKYHRSKLKLLKILTANITSHA